MPILRMRHPIHRFLFSALTLLVLTVLISGKLLCAQEAKLHPTPTQPTSALPNWQYGFFASGGFPPNYQIPEGLFTSSTGQSEQVFASEKLYFWNAGFQGGRMMTRWHGHGLLRRRTEAMLEVMPFWMARYPRQDLTYYIQVISTTVSSGYFGPQNFFGSSITPVLYRWNFQPHPDSRNLSWAQVGGGLLWTNHKFPNNGDTSVINFTPQIGFGYSRFLRDRQSLDLALKLMHISNAGLGDNDPGVGFSLFFSAGYSWWK